jgi:MFS family permease
MFPADRRGRALGVWAAVNGGSLTAGPLLGGLLVTALGWRGVFAFDVALAVAAFAAAQRLVPDVGRRDSGPIDYGGAALLVGALVALLTTLSAAAASGAASVALAGALVTVVTGTAWFATALRRPDPFLDPRLFRRGTFGVLNAIVGLQMLFLFGIFFAVPLLLVVLHDVSNARAGVAVALTPLVATVLAPFAGRVADRVGTRLPVAAGATLLCAAGAGLAAAVDGGGAAVVAALVVAGIGISLIQSPVAAEVTRVVEGERAGLAVGIFNATRLVSGALGTALFTLVFQLAGSIAPGAGLEAVAHDSLAAGFRAVFAAMAVAGAAALAAALAWGPRFWRPSKAPADTRERHSGGR